MKNLPKHTGAMALAFLALAVTITGFVYASSGNTETTDDAYVNADFTLIAPKVEGFIRDVLVEDNQYVRAGDVLARIDDDDYRVELAAAKAKTATSKAKLRNAAALLKRQEAEIRQVEAGLAADKAEVNFAQHESERYKNLASQGAGTLQNSQQARTRLAKASAQLNNRKAMLDAARTQVEVLEASQQSASADLDHAKAMLDKAQLNVSYTELRAPFDGVIGRRSVRKGAFVKPGAMLMAVVPQDKFYITANFREVQLTNVRPGQRAEIKVDTFPGQTLLGTVESLAPATGVTFAPIAPDNATGNFTKVVQRIPVKIVLEPSQPLISKLKVGMSVEASIRAGDVPEAAQ
ncbi:HlyD family secretion protein [Enterobacterales bacterium BD_CKDN230030183-1A_HGKHYDSX7]